MEIDTRETIGKMRAALPGAANGPKSQCSRGFRSPLLRGKGRPLRGYSRTEFFFESAQIAPRAVAPVSTGPWAGREIIFGGSSGAQVLIQFEGVLAPTWPCSCIASRIERKCVERFFAPRSLAGGR